MSIFDKKLKMAHHQADVSASISVLSAVVTISSVQPIVSLCAGLVAIVSGVFAIRYYYWKTKNIKKDGKD
jgi:hypothetical protein